VAGPDRPDTEGLDPTARRGPAQARGRDLPAPSGTTPGGMMEAC